MKLEDITVEGIQEWIKFQKKNRTHDDNFMADISLPLAKTQEIDGLVRLTTDLATVSARLGTNPVSAIIAFGICIGLEIAADKDKESL